MLNIKNFKVGDGLFGELSGDNESFMQIHPCGKVIFASILSNSHTNGGRIVLCTVLLNYY